MQKYNIFHNLRFSLRLLKEDRFQSFYIYSFLHIVLGVLCPLLLAVFPSYVVGIMAKGGGLGTPIIRLVLFITGILLLQMADTYCLRTYEQILFLFRNKQGERLMKKALEIPFYLCESPQGQRQFEKARRAVYEGNQNGIEIFLKQFTEICVNLLGMLAYGIVIGAANPLFILMLLGFTSLAAFASKLTGKKDCLVQEELGGEYTRLQYMCQATLDEKSAKDIRIYQAQKWFLEEFASIREKARKLQDKSAGYYLLFDNLERILAFVRDIIVYGSFIYLMYQGRMSIEQFLLNIGVVAGFNGWIMGLFGNIKELTRNNTIVGHFKDYLSYGEEQRGGEENAPNPGTPHTLTMEHVSFQYPEAEKACIEDLNFTVNSGEKLALVGTNGAGKSTIIKLLLGLYEPAGGRILLDWTDIRRIDKESYFREFAAAFQEVFAFAASIADNVTGVPEKEADGEQLKEKLTMAGLWEFTQKQPHKERTSVTKALDPEGIQLSGGEMQKLMLARTLYKDAPVVILDEPTAALDPIAEHELYQKYSMLTQGKTSIFISHRLSSTRFCDRILFLENGKVAEVGTHEELMSRKGKYANMYEIQAKYYRKEEQGYV